jgi:hypothetical protein
MNLTDERLRLAYSDALRDRARAERVTCVPPETLLALVEHTGSEAARLEALDHVMACTRCRRELDLVRASLAAAGTARSRSWFRSPSFGLMSLAALLLVVAGVRLYVVSGDAESGPRLRGGSGIAIHPVAWTRGVGAGLAWHPATGAASYRLEVIDDAGRAVVDTTLRDTSFVVADSLVRDRAGIMWTVSAILDDGTSVSSLPARLTPPRP